MEKKREAIVNQLPRREHRDILARWPDVWRQRWGFLANKLIDDGVELWEAEEKAFQAIRTQINREEAPTHNQPSLQMETKNNHKSPYDKERDPNIP